MSAPVVAIVMPSLIALIQFGDPSVFFAVFFSLSVIQIALSSILDPRLLGDSLNISPIMIIFSLAAWAMIWGVPGMFLSVPILGDDRDHPVAAGEYAADRSPDDQDRRYLKVIDGQKQVMSIRVKKS
jgi:hypothetical protein